MKRFPVIVAVLAMLSVSTVTAQNDRLGAIQQLWANHQTEAAFAGIDSLLSRNYADADLHALKAGFHSSLALSSQDSRIVGSQMMKALEESDISLLINPEQPQALMIRGNILLNSPIPFTNYEMARKDFATLVKIQPSNAQAAGQLAIASQKAGVSPGSETPRAVRYKEHQGGRLEFFNGFWIIHLKGSHYEMGYQQGMLVKDGIKTISSDLFQNIMKYSDNTIIKIRDAVQLFDKNIPEEFRQQMHGIADAVECPYEDVLAMNFFTDVVLTGLCHGGVTLDEATKARTVLYGSSIELGGTSLFTLLRMTGNGRNQFILVCEPDSGNTSITVLPFPLAIWGYAGMNSAGLAVGSTGLFTNDMTFDGIPSMLLIRIALERAGSIDQALDYVKSAKRTRGASMTIADSSTARVIEFGSKHFAVLSPRGNRLHENNLMADTTLASLSQTILPDGLKNYMVSRRQSFDGYVTQNYGQMDPDRTADMLRTLSIPETLFCGVFNPARKEFWVARGPLPVASNEFSGFNFDNLVDGSYTGTTPATLASGGDELPQKFISLMFKKGMKQWKITE